jgi:DNA polymerase-1
MKNHNFIITKDKDINKLISYCKKTNWCSFDFETNGYPFHHPLFLPTTISISFQPGTSYVIPLAHKDSPLLKGKKWLKVLKRIGRRLFENTDIIKVGWNIKFEALILKIYNIELIGRVFDAMLAKYLLQEERPNDLKSIVAMFLPEFANYDLKGQPSGDDLEKTVKFWSNVELNELCKYNGLDSDLTLRLMWFFESKLIQHGFYKLFRNMLMMGTRVLIDSELKGFNIDKPYLDNLVKSYKIKVDELEEELYNHPVVKRFEKSLIKERINNYIISIEEEIEDLENELNKTSKKEDKKINALNKKIKTRNDKITSIRNGNIVTKKEEKLFERFNMASPKQLIGLLFTSKYGFRFKVIRNTVDKNKKETDNPSTDESVLNELLPKDKSGFIEGILRHRGLSKLYSTYVLGMHNKLSNGNRIHGSFLLHGTVTGRLSSRNPNLQNIPRDTTASDIKKMFITDKGYNLLQLDYSQAELRVIAAASKETEMLKWFRENRDIHLAVACDKNKWDYDWALLIYEKEDKNDPNFIKIKTERKFAKTINFGIIYGQGANMLSLGMGTSVKEAQKYLDQYTKRFPNIWKFINKQHKYANKNGYVYNLFGRKRRLPNIWSSEWGKKAEAQRQSVNAPIQGAASDYTLFSSILIWEMVQKGLLPRDFLQIFTVHDSLGFLIKPKDIHKTIPILEKICSNPETKEWFDFQIDEVTMKVDFEISDTNWAQLNKYLVNKEYN